MRYCTGYRKRPAREKPNRKKKVKSLRRCPRPRLPCPFCFVSGRRRGLFRCRRRQLLGRRFIHSQAKEQPLSGKLDSGFDATGGAVLRGAGFSSGLHFSVQICVAHHPLALEICCDSLALTHTGTGTYRPSRYLAIATGIPVVHHPLQPITRHRALCRPEPACAPPRAPRATWP